MNEIVKKRIQEKLMKAMDEESLKPGQVAKLLRINPIYVSMIKNENHWDKCPRTTWETVLLWINSGESMKVYSEKQIEILKEARLKKEQKVEDKTEGKVEETVKENPVIIEFTKANASKLIALLKTERLLLEKQINAINTLLESYQPNNQ